MCGQDHLTPIYESGLSKIEKWSGSLHTLLSYDSDYLSLKIWQNILHLQGQMLQECIAKEAPIYLFLPPSNSRENEIQIQNRAHVKNISMSSVLNLSIVSKNSGKEILSVRELSPHKELQFEFKKEGAYELIYSFVNQQKFEKQIIKVVPRRDSSQPYPPNYNPDLNPNWAKRIY